MVKCSHCGAGVDPKDIRCGACLEFNESYLTAAIDRYYHATGVSDPENGAYRHRDTFQRMVKQVFPQIEQAAENEQIVTYPDVWGDGVDPYGMKYYLGAVSAVEHWDGRPLLTSIVVKAERGYPSDGYFDLVDWFDGPPRDVQGWTTAEKEDWWEEEVTEVHEFWASRG